MKIYKLALLALLFGQTVNVYSFSVVEPEGEVISQALVANLNMLIEFTESNNSDSLRQSLFYLKNSMSNDELRQLIDLQSCGYTSLTIALDKGYLECARMLIEHGADLMVRDSAECFTPLIWSIVTKKDDDGNNIYSSAHLNSLVDLVINSKKDQLNRDIMAKRKSEEQAKKAYKAFLNQKDENNKTALWHSFASGYFYPIRLLINEGAAIDKSFLLKLINNNLYHKLITKEVILKMDSDEAQKFFSNVQKCLAEYLRTRFTEQDKKYADEVNRYFNELLVFKTKDEEGLKSVESKNIFEVLKAREFAKR